MDNNENDKNEIVKDTKLDDEKRKLKIALAILSLFTTIILCFSISYVLMTQRNKKRNNPEEKEQKEIIKHEENEEQKMGTIEETKEEAKEETKEEEKETKSTNNIQKGIPGPVKDDTFAMIIWPFGPDGEDKDNLTLMYYTLKDGKVYELIESVKDNEYYDTGHYLEEIESVSFQTYQEQLKEIEGLPPIKRIKGFVDLGTDWSYKGLLLVAENGEVYTYTLLAKSSAIEKAKYLDDYKVDDILGYYIVGGCVSEDPNFKTCGGEYNIIDKNGKKHHYLVNTDGSLTAK